MTPNRDAFLARFRDNPPTDRRLLVPVWREILFDTETAVTAYAKIAAAPFGFLLESVVGGETWARYTFLGTNPREAWRIHAGGRLRRWTRDQGWHPEEEQVQPLELLEQHLQGFEVADAEGLPRFVGGAVGYFGYDTIRYIERLPNAPTDDLGLPDAVLMFTDTVIAIDNLFGRARVISLAEVAPGCDWDDIERAWDAAAARVDALIARLQDRPAPAPLSLHSGAVDAEFRSNYTRAEFERDVERVREYIAAGDVFQVVLSQRLSVPLEVEPFELYRQLRSLNPSPYLYFLQLDDLALVGSSPEVLVRVEDSRVTVRPIAGTRPRARDDARDSTLALELLEDPKEKAEHLMLVDLGRNDVGRVSEYGTVTVPELMRIERYSHVLHMVSDVEGRLREGLTCIDVLRACFPAGTVSGAPKVRAMEIIDELEPTRRGPYAGAVGYFAYGARNMDTAIAIRTLIAANGQAHIQAGAGIVADSNPAAEYEETIAKARALLRIVHPQ